MTTRISKWSLIIILIALTISLGLALNHKLGRSEIVTLDTASIAGGSSLSILLGRGNLFSQACCKHSQNLQENKKGIKFTLRTDDQLVKKSMRSELRALPEQFKEKIIYEFSVKLNDELLERNEHIIIAQWHASKDIFLLEKGRFPPLEIAVVNGTWKIIKTVSKISGEIKTRPSTAERKVLYEAPISTLNHRFKVEALWSHTSEGTLSINHNDKEVVKNRGPNTYNDFWGPYFKFGLYIPEWKAKNAENSTESVSIFFDELKISKAY